MLDLFSRLEPTCGDCVQMDAEPLPSGIRYCWGEMTWRFPDDRVSACPYRDKPPQRAQVTLRSIAGLILFLALVHSGLWIGR